MVLLLVLSAFPGFVEPARALTADLYSGAGMVLHLSRVKGRTSEVRGVIYSREAAYKFEAKRRGTGFRATELYARNDRLAPYRQVEGTLELQVREGGEKVSVEMSSPLRNMSAIFRLQMDARAFNLLTQYGENYCDLNHLVLIVTDRPRDVSRGWLSKVIGEDAELMPVIGLFFGPRVWYTFQASGDPGAGLTSSSLMIGDGALEGYLGRATLKARVDGNQLFYTYADAAGSTSYQLGYRSQDKLCARVVTRWTARRRMPRGRVAEKEPQQKKPDEETKAPARVREEEEPAREAEPAKPKPAEETAAREPSKPVTAPTGDAPKRVAPDQAREERLGRKKPGGEAEPAAPNAAEDLPPLEGAEAPIPEDLLYEELPTDIPPGEYLPEGAELLPGGELPPGEYFPEGTEPLPGEEYLYPEGNYYEPLPGEEYLDDPLYQELPEELPPGELPEQVR